MIENSALLIYIWGIYPQIGDAVGNIFFFYMLTMVFSWVYLVVHYMNLKEVIDYYTKYFKTATIVVIALFVVNALTPTRNVLMMMVAADPLLELASDIKDSNTTQRLANIFDDSLTILEQKVKEQKGK